MQGKKENVFKVLVGKPEGNRELKRPRHGWENNIKTGMKELEPKGTDQIHMA
jgi:hypothetical protein